MTNAGKVFISYSRGDADQANFVRIALSSNGLGVWWDENLLAGERWQQELDDQLTKAEAIIVLWSENSVRSNWVLFEASIAKRLDKLVNVKIEDTNLPKPFENIQCGDLTAWCRKGLQARDNDPDFRALVESIAHVRRKRANATKMVPLRGCVIITLIIIGLLLGAAGAIFIELCISDKEPCPVPVQYIELRSDEFHSGTFDVSSWPEFDDAQLTLDGTHYPLANLRALCFPIENGQGFIEVETNDGKRTRYLATTDFLQGRKILFKGRFAREEFPISKIKCLRWHCVQPATLTDK